MRWTIELCNKKLGLCYFLGCFVGESLVILGKNVSKLRSHKAKGSVLQPVVQLDGWACSTRSLSGFDDNRWQLDLVNICRLCTEWNNGLVQQCNIGLLLAGKLGFQLVKWQLVPHHPQKDCNDNCTDHNRGNDH